ncbi:MAG: hypothetical protein IT379_12155 [Deltaproteobacteria bacterium]|nr:hypothetical protein [Deltaproteobacteria bacterium]
MLALGDPIDPARTHVRRIHAFDEARRETLPGHRVRTVRRAAERFGDALREGPRVVCVRTLPLAMAPYPTAYAFWNACSVPAPVITMFHRCLLIQVLAEGELKTILFNPSDPESQIKTPYFANFRKAIPSFIKTEWLSPKQPTLEEQLARLGLRPEDIDVVAFDHFHTQDLRVLLGTDGSDGRPPTAPRFPNAVLLAPRVEWDAWEDLHPLHRAFFIADGRSHVKTERVVLVEGDMWLGDGCAIVSTPGHTNGNQTLFVHAEQGVFGTAENGTSADCYSPFESRIPGLRKFARERDVEVILNSNTPESGADQYTSMILERTVVDQVPDAPMFVQMFPSSELTPSILAPGIRPSMLFGERTSGTVQLPDRAARAKSAGARLEPRVQA